MRTAKSILRECFLGVIDFNEEAALAAMKKYAEVYHESKVKKFSFNPPVIGSFLADLLDELPENRPLYKDSGLWQQRSDDMEDVYYQQRVNEKTEDFIKRLYEARNDR